MYKVVSPRYKQIAVDIANRIYHGSINEGEKIHGRSTLAGEYNVSPETIRRSIKLLEDMDVLTVSKGSGITVLSKDKAYSFIERFQEVESLGIMKNQLESLINKKREIDGQVNELVNRITDLSDRLKNVNPLNTVEVPIPKSWKKSGDTIKDLKFWQNTGGTIVGIRREENLIISPGPYATIEEGDTILVVGDYNVINNVSNYINNI